MKTSEIRECLQTLEIDEALVEHFIKILTIVRAKALNGHKASVLHLRDLLMEAVDIGSYNCDAYGALSDALETQICKMKASLKKFE